MRRLMDHNISINIYTYYNYFYMIFNDIKFIFNYFHMNFIFILFIY